MLSEKIVTTEGAARLTASEKLRWLALIALGRGTFGSKAARILGLKKTTKKAILRPANKGGRTNFISFSTIFLLCKWAISLWWHKKNNSGKCHCYFYYINSAIYYWIKINIDSRPRCTPSTILPFVLSMILFMSRIVSTRWRFTCIIISPSSRPTRAEGERGSTEVISTPLLLFFCTFSSSAPWNTGCSSSPVAVTPDAPSRVTFTVLI